MPNSILPHSVTVDPETRLIILTMSGVISVEDGAWMGEEVRSAVRSLGAPMGQHVTLYDFFNVPVVPQATVDQLLVMLTNPAVRQLWARKLAILVGTTLGRLQAEEIKAVRPDIRIFEDREEALAWLLND